MDHRPSSASDNQKGDSPAPRTITHSIHSGPSTPQSKTSRDFKESDLPVNRTITHSIHSGPSTPQSKTSRDFKESDLPVNRTITHSIHSGPSTPQSKTSHDFNESDLPVNRTATHSIHSGPSTPQSKTSRDFKESDLPVNRTTTHSIHSGPSTPQNKLSHGSHAHRSTAHSVHGGSPSQPRPSDEATESIVADNLHLQLPNADDGKGVRHSASSDVHRTAAHNQPSKGDQRSSRDTSSVTKMNVGRETQNQLASLAKQMETLGLDEEEFSGEDQETDLVMKWLDDQKSNQEEFMPMTDVQDAKASGMLRELHVTNLVDMEQCNPVAPAPVEDIEDANAATLLISLQEALELLRVERSRNRLLLEGLAGNVKEVFDVNTNLENKHKELAAKHAALEQEKNTLHQVALGLKRECKKQRSYFHETLGEHEAKHATLKLQLAEAKRNVRNDDYNKEIVALEAISDNKIVELEAKNRELEATLKAAEAETDTVAKNKELEDALEVAVAQDSIAELEAKNQELETALTAAAAEGSSVIAELKAKNQELEAALAAAAGGGDRNRNSSAIPCLEATDDEDLDVVSVTLPRSPTSSARPLPSALEKELRGQIAALESKNELLQATGGTLRAALENVMGHELRNPAMELSNRKMATRGSNMQRSTSDEDFNAELEQNVVIGMDKAVQEWKEVRGQDTYQSGETPEFLTIRERMKQKREARLKVQKEQVTDSARSSDMEKAGHGADGMMNAEVWEDDDLRKLESINTVLAEESGRIDTAHSVFLACDDEKNLRTNSGRSANTVVLAQLYHTRAREAKFRRRFKVLMTMR